MFFKNKKNQRKDISKKITKTNKDKKKSFSFISFLKTAFLVFLACLMILCVIPPALFTKPNRVDRRGELIRVLPSEIKSNASRFDNTSVLIGNDASALMSFNLGDIENLDTKDISHVRLRVSFLNGTGGNNNRIYITLPGENSLNNGDKLLSLSNNLLYKNDIHSYGNRLETTVHTSGGDNSVYTTDITDTAITALKSKNKNVVLGIWGQSNINVAMASDEFSDPYCRPYIEIVTKTAGDYTPLNSSKASVTDAVYVSSSYPDDNGLSLSGKSGGLICGQTDEIYLKFKINHDIIEGNIYKATLNMHSAYPKSFLPQTGTATISLVNNSSWQGDSVTYNNRPAGEELSIPVSAAVTKDGIYADVTQSIAEAFNAGLTYVTFKITSSSSLPMMAGIGKNLTAPKLLLKSTDNKDIVSATNAALKALNGNNKKYVTTDLLKGYKDENGRTSKLSWQQLDLDETRRGNDYLKSNGSISRPKWFEGNMQIIALAKITCGDYTTTRRYPLTLRAESAPNYTGYTFDNYIKLGNQESEKAQKFESINLSNPVHTIFAGGRHTYRKISKGSCTLLNLGCSADGANYLTLKLSIKDCTGTTLYITPCGENTETIPVSLPSFNDENDGFVYVTCGLPQSITQNKSYVSLRLTLEDQSYNTVGKSNANQNTTLSEPKLFAAYITQDPSFDPKQFASVGEKQASEISSAGERILGFLYNASDFLNMSYSDNPKDLLDKVYNTSTVTGTSKNQELIISSDGGSVLFYGITGNIAFSFNDHTTDGLLSYADIYERYTYYDRISSAPVSTSKYDDGVVTFCDFGEYILFYNKSNTAKTPIIPDNYEKAGIYKNVTSDEYYLINNDDGIKINKDILPKDKSAIDISSMTIPADQVVLLKRLTGSRQDSAWQITAVNRTPLSEINLKSGSTISDITLRCADTIKEDMTDINLLIGVYKNGHLLNMSRSKTTVIPGINIYSFDLSSDSLIFTEGSEIKVFIYDNTENLYDISPKFIYPQ